MSLRRLLGAVATSIRKHIPGTGVPGDVMASIRKHISGTSVPGAVSAQVRDLVPGMSLRARVKRFLLGDPRKAPSRIIKTVVFLMLMTSVVGIWAIVGLNVDTEGSSYWAVVLFAKAISSVWILPVLMIVAWRQYLGRRRDSKARQAADITGWLSESIKQLSDEIRTTDYTRRVIASTDMTLEEITGYVDHALDDESHDAEVVDYHTPYDDTQPALPAGDTADVDENDSDDDAFDAGERDDVAWRIVVMEELKHFALDVSAGLRRGDFLLKFVLPATVAFLVQWIWLRLWISPVLFLVIIVNSLLVGVTAFWAVKRRRRSRLSTYRAPSTDDYWESAAAQVKTVETADVTAYMGWIAGRRYASYDREEFLREFSKRLHQRVSGDDVAPSILEHYARCLSQMQPNLRGYLEEVERVDIMRDIKHAVETAEDDIIPKANLAYDVITGLEDTRFEESLGHDPALVAEAYQWFVEDAYELAETTMLTEDASGNETDVVIVYPAEKQRLPEAVNLHARFSDRFLDAHGDPIYELPDVEPDSNVSGLQLTPEQYERLPAPRKALPEGESNHTTSPT